MTQPVRLGIVMLCHDELALAARIVRLWVESGAAIAVHVDSRSPQAHVTRMHSELADLRQLVFVRRRPCEWGMFGLVQATQDAATLLLERFEDITHVLLLSGSCLPLRPIPDLLAYLARYPRRDFIESVNAADVGWTMGGLNEERFTLHFPFSFRRARRRFDMAVALQRRLGVRRRIPQGLVPHLGSQWWCLTRETLGAILNDPRRVEYDNYFRNVWVPDESYFQTIARRHSVRIESRSLTLAKFDGQGKPYTFYDDHRQMLAESGCFIARKIWPGAQGLYAYFPRPPAPEPSIAEPRPARIRRLIDRAVARRRLGRPGLYMQSCYPRNDSENGKTSAPYGVLYGFTDLFPDFEEWLAARVDADVHGHLFAPDTVEFAGRPPVGPGALPARPGLRDLDERGFLTSLIRMTQPRMQIFQASARDRDNLDWFTATDPNARVFVITGVWAVPLFHSDMPFDDIRRTAAVLQQRELHMLGALQSIWLKARLQSWNLADFAARPAGALESVLHGLGAGIAPPGDLPAMRDLTGFGRFLQRLRNAGLRPKKMGDFSVDEPAGKAKP